MKKLLIIPVVALLAAGCSSGAVTSQTQNVPASTSTSSAASQEPPMMQASTTMPEMSGAMWEGTLQASDNPAKGNLMLVTGGHTIYLHTSRDYSALVGKDVMVDYNGNLTSFSVVDIMAK